MLAWQILDTLSTHAQNPLNVQVPGSLQQKRAMEIHMADCPLVRLTENLKLLKQFEQSGQVVIPIDDWLWFFEALAFITRDGGQREIYCAIRTQCLLLSKTPIKRKAKRKPTQDELFER